MTKKKQRNISNSNNINAIQQKARERDSSININNISPDYKKEFNITLSQTQNIEKIHSIINNYSRKRIVLRDMRELGWKNTGGAETENDSFIIIWVDTNNDIKVQEITYIHELLHRVLRYEGYPTWHYEIHQNFYNEPQMIYSIEKMASIIGSHLEHPEIYYRMKNDFQLDLDKYFSIKYQSLINSLNDRPILNENDIIFDMQTTIIQGYDAMFYKSPYDKKSLLLIEDKYPGLSKYIEEFFAKAGDSYHSPQGCLATLQIYKSLVKKFVIDFVIYNYAGEIGDNFYREIASEIYWNKNWLDYWGCFQFKLNNC